VLEAVAGTALGGAELLNPLDGRPHARFLAFRSPEAMRWHNALDAKNCITDVRGDVLRIGLGLYHDEDDIGRLAGLLETLT
jgi:selenocysteine lyase/cysteine desulfurase